MAGVGAGVGVWGGGVVLIAVVGGIFMALLSLNIVSDFYFGGTGI